MELYRRTLKTDVEYTLKFYSSIMIFILLMSCIVTVNGHSSGAPTGACVSMTPGHGSQKTGVAPYAVTPSKTSINTQDPITVTVSATGGTQFKGLLLKTLPSDVGTFSNLPVGTRLECSGNGVTHTTNALKTSVSLNWTPPSSYSGNIQFVATIVEDYSNYYKDVRSSSLTIQMSDAIAPDSDCGVTKGCFNDCQNGQCSYMLTWRDVGTDIEFEMAQTVTAGADKWIAVGFSQDQRMGNDDVVLCKTSNAGVDVENGNNPGYYYQTNPNNKNGLSQTGGSLAGTKMTCTFRRTKSPVGQSSMVDFTNPYHLLLAHGNLLSGNPSKHQESPNISPTTANLLDNRMVIAPGVTTAPVTTTSDSITPDSDCGVTKGCFNDCQNGQCSYMFTWRDVGNDIEFEMAQTVTAGSDKWIAVGLSQDQSMGNDNVILCKTSNAGVDVENGYNPGYYYQKHQNSTYGLSQTGGSLTGTKMTCTFRRIKSPVNQENMVDFTDPIYLLLAHGNVIAGNPSKHQESPNISPTKANLLDNRMVISPGVTTAPTAPVTTPSRAGISDPGCGTSKGCFPDCQGTGCSFLATWASDGGDIVFEIAAGIPTSNNIWMAIGFSSDNKMGGDSVTACKLANGVVSAEVGHTNGYSYQRLGNPQAGLSSISGSYTDSVFRCQFRRARNLTSEANFFDLNTPWHILFAHGPLNNGNVRKHQQQPVASASTVDFLSIEMVSGQQPNYSLTKVHGSFMTFAWILFSSIGIIIAKFFKTTWPDSEVAGQKVWFLVHRGCMTTVLLCTIIGVITIFVDIGGYSQFDESKTFVKAHPVLGLMVTALTLTNPIMAMFRCAPDHEHRPIFNFFHSVVGLTAHILAGITIVFGTYLDRSGLDRKSTYVAIAYIITFSLSVIILRLLDWKQRPRSENVNIEMKSSSEQELASVDVKNGNDGGSVYKLFVLAVMAVAMFTYSLIIVVFLIQGKQ